MIKILLSIILLTTFILAEDNEETNIFENIDFEYSAFLNSFNNSKIDGKKYSKNEFWNKLNIRNQTDLTDNIQLKIDIVAMYNTEGDNQNGILTKPNNDDNDVRYIDISKLYLTYFFDDMDLYLGKKSKKIGLSEIYSPSDIFTKSIVSTPQHPVEIGAFTLGLDYYIDDSTLNFSIFPTNTNYGMPDIDSRWLQGGDYNFYTLDNDAGNIPSGSIVENEENNSDIKNWGLLLQYSGTISSMDYYIYLARKKSLYPILLQENTLTYKKAYPISSYVAVGLLKVVKENKFYIDLVYQDTQHDLDQDFIKYNIGAKHRQSEYAGKIGLDEIAIIAEISEEIIVNKGLSSKVYQDSEYSRINKNNITLSTHFIKDSQLSYMFSVNYSFDKYDNFMNHTVKYNRNDNQAFYLSYYDYNGDSDTNFGRWADNDNIEIGIEYKF